MPNGHILSQYPPVPEQATSFGYKQLLLLDAITANDVGIWVPFAPFSKGSFEVTAPSTFTGTVALYASNAAYMPPNALQIAVGGTKTTGDVLTVSIACGDLMGGAITASYTVLAGDTLATIAAGLTTALQTAIKSASIVFANPNPPLVDAAYIEVTNPSAPSDNILVQWQFPLAPITINNSLSTGATETLTVTQIDDGEGFLVPNCSLTATGNVVFSQPCRWMKAKCTGYSGVVPITAIVVATLP